MAFINSNDVKVFILRETEYGKMPTSGNRYELPRKQGGSFMDKDFGLVPSDTLRPGRNGNGSRRGNQSASGTIEINAITAPVVDLLLESALSSTFDGDALKAGDTVKGAAQCAFQKQVYNRRCDCALSSTFDGDALKAGDKDVSFTYVAVLGPNQFKITTGCMATGVTLNGQAAEGVTYSFDVMGAKQEEVTTLTGTYTDVLVDDAAYEYLGSEILNIKAAGSTALKFTTLELAVTQGRNARNVLSSNASAGLSASGAREVNLTLTVYRESGVNYETVLTGEPQEFSYDLGIAGYGRHFTVYGQAAGLADAVEDDLMLTITVTGKYDSEQETALVVEKLV